MPQKALLAEITYQRGYSGMTERVEPSKIWVLNGKKEKGKGEHLERNG